MPPDDPVSPIIELAGLRQSFGKHEVLRGVDMRVPAGKIYAFLGRNGAGKTTLIRTLMGLLRPAAGALRVNGFDPARDPLTIRRSVGYLAEDQDMWGWMKVAEILRFIAAFYPAWNWEYAQQLLDKFQLPSGAKIRHLSKGQNVRLGLLLALAHRPRLVILDDPVLGLDPIMRKEFLRDIVTHLQGTDAVPPGGMTVFFSSHLLYEIEPVADIVGILDHGRLVCESPTETLREQVRQLIVSRSAWGEYGAEVRRATTVLDLKEESSHIAVIVRDAGKARAVLDGAVEEDRGLNLDEIFEAFVVGNSPSAMNNPQALAAAR